MKRVAKPFTVETRRSGRKKPDVEPAQVSGTVEAPAQSPVPITEAATPKRRQGRILPALDPVMPEPSQSDAKPDLPPPIVRGRTPEAKQQPLPNSAELDEIASNPALNAQKNTDDPLLPTRALVRLRPKRLPRGAFHRSERWKHWLPKAVHRKLVKSVK